MLKNQLLNKFEGIATYQISLKGTISKNLLDRLGGMSVHNNTNTKPAISTLTGVLTDQSALSGVLNTLFDYRYEVISVLKLDIR